MTGDVQASPGNADTLEVDIWLRAPGEPRAPAAATRLRATSAAACGLRRRLRLSTGCQRRDIARHAALHRFNPFAVFEADQIAGDNRPRSGQAGEPLAHRGKRHAHFLGNLQIEPLTVFLQALQDFDHDAYPPQKKRSLPDSAGLLFTFRSE